jgi:hypothetical protein
MEYLVSLGIVEGTTLAVKRRCAVFSLLAKGLGPRRLNGRKGVLHSGAAHLCVLHSCVDH